jgi:putative transposase
LYQSPINWLAIHWIFLKTHLIEPDGLYLLAGDEVVESKAGQATYSVGWFYSGFAQGVIPSVAFLRLSVIDVKHRKSYPLYVEQIMPKQLVPDDPLPLSKRPRGRPKGRKSYAKPEPVLNPLLQLLASILMALQLQITYLQIKQIVLDGNFGNYPTTWTVRQTGLHIISKMKCNAALYLPYVGDKPRRGSTPRYGDKLNYNHLPAAALLTSHLEDDYQIDTYQLQLYHQDYPDLLNTVVLVKTHLKTRKHGHIVLFSSDLTLTAQQLVDFYSLRFQIEFNFRDTKQYWGLHDFMNVKQQAVINAINLAFFMTNFSQVMLEPYRQHDSDFSVLDLKAQFRARRYLSETIKMLPETSEPHLISRIWQRLSCFGGIRTPQLHDFAA